MTIEQLNTLPVGTRVCWNGWGDLDAGTIAEQQGERFIYWDDGSIDRPNGLDLVEVMDTAYTQRVAETWNQDLSLGWTSGQGL